MVQKSVFGATISTDIKLLIEAKVVTWLEMRSRWERNARLLQRSDGQGYTADISDKKKIISTDLYIDLISIFT